MKLTADAVRALALPAGKADAIVFDDAVPGFGLRMREKGSRTFVFQYAIGPKQRRMVLGAATALNAAEARETARRLYARVKLGEDPAGERAEAQMRAGETFGVIAARYLDDRRREMRPRSHVQTSRHLIIDSKMLHRLQLVKVTRRDVAACIASIRSRAPVHSNRVRSTLSAFFAWCMAQGLAEANPVIGTQASKEKARARVLDGSELRAIWNALSDDDFGAILKLLMLTGQRGGEIGGLCWSEVYANVIKLPAERVKNNRPHSIPLSEPACDVLAKQRRRNDRDRIFGRGARGFNDWAKRKDALDLRIAENTGQRLPHWTIHDLRRSFATHGAELGIAPHIVETILNHVGHKSGVAGVYNRSVYEREVKAALDRWAVRLLAVVEGKEGTS